MAGLYNSNIRDYCGDESAISKISNHFSKDYSLKQEGLNQNTLPSGQPEIPTTFNLNELLRKMMKNDEVLLSQNVNNDNNEALIETNNSVPFFVTSNDKPFTANNSTFISPLYFTIPQPVFCAPDHSVVANEWARHELSQFDNSILTEDDLKALSQSNEAGQQDLRFSEVIRQMALDDETKEINISDDNMNHDYMYDLDHDLKNMREKLLFNEESVDMWPQLNDNTTSKSKEFCFIKDNHYAESLQSQDERQSEKADEMLKKGIKLYQGGYFSEAMLILEAVVQAKPKSEEGWHYLALSLSENEQDQRATIACMKCLEINKDNQEILMSLARIHCNEMNIASTIVCLERWLLSNPKYADLATVGQEALFSLEDADDSMWQAIFEDAFESSGKFSIIEQQLKTAKERNGSDIDPNIEIALGTLYHVIQDYDKSTVYFENASKVSDDNALLWNKLGTSYCNSGDFAKAISTYQKALRLAPGFVRAECNLGVAFYNMAKYSEAIKHALRAHKLQHSTQSTSHNAMETSTTFVETDPIWTLIRMSCFKMDRSDLDLVVFSRDVDTLVREFDS